MRSQKAIITAAITGAVHVSSMSPALPVTPEEIIAQSVAAREAGAAVVHIHARNPETGEPSSDLELMREIVSGIKRQSDVIICITTGASQMMTTEERLAPIPALRPEVASCNAGSINFVLADLAAKLTPDGPAWERKYLEGTRNNVFSNTYTGLEQYITTMNQNGTRPEFEVYDVGMINNIAYFVRKGIIQKPVYLQFVLGIQGGMPATAENLVFLHATAEKLLEDFVWSAAAAGRNQFPITSMALAMGGNARVGLEDNLYIRPGVLAESNAQQVRAIRSVAEVLGREVASPEEARAILNLKGLGAVAY